MRSHATLCVLIPVYVSAYYSICVLILLYMCPHTAIYVSAYYSVCVLMLLYVSSYYCICVRILLYMRPHTAINVSSYCYVCVRILLCMRPHTAIYVASYCYYMCPHTAIYVSAYYSTCHYICVLHASSCSSVACCIKALLTAFYYCILLLHFNFFLLQIGSSEEANVAHQWSAATDEAHSPLRAPPLLCLRTPPPAGTALLRRCLGAVKALGAPPLLCLRKPPPAGNYFFSLC
jgi:hypothetical protein